MTSDPTSIQASETDQNLKILTIANGKILNINSIGSSTFVLADKSVQLKNILLALMVNNNLLSVSRFCKDNEISLRFDKDHAYLKGLQGTNEELVIGNVRQGLYQIELNLASELNSYKSTDIETWHRHFGHICEGNTHKNNFRLLSVFFFK